MSGGLVGPSGGVVDVLYPVAIRILVAPIGPLMPSLLLSIKPEIYWVLALRLSASGQFWSVLNGRGCLTPALSLLSALSLPSALCVDSNWWLFLIRTGLICTGSFARRFGCVNYWTSGGFVPVNVQRGADLFSDQLQLPTTLHCPSLFAVSRSSLGCSLQRTFEKQILL